MLRSSSTARAQGTAQDTNNLNTCTPHNTDNIQAKANQASTTHSCTSMFGKRPCSPAGAPKRLLGDNRGVWFASTVLNRLSKPGMKQQSPGPGNKSRCAAKHAYQATGASHYAVPARPKTAHTSLPTPSHIYATAVHTGVQAGQAAAHSCCRKAHTHPTPTDSHITQHNHHCYVKHQPTTSQGPHSSDTAAAAGCCGRRRCFGSRQRQPATAAAAAYSAVAGAVSTRASASLTPQ